MYQSLTPVVQKNHRYHRLAHQIHSVLKLNKTVDQPLADQIDQLEAQADNQGHYLV